MSERRAGILGGTFDPVHYAHLAIAEEARESLDLALVTLVPSGTPVHKPPAGVTPPEHRLAMVDLAIADNPCFRSSRIEIDRDGPSYSVDTVEAMTRQEPATDFFFLMSAEAAKGLPGWRSPQRLLELCRVAVVPRLGFELPSRAWLDAQFPGQADRITFVDTPALGHSGSNIRARVRAGRSIRYLVPPAVEEYIVQHGLYRSS